LPVSSFMLFVAMAVAVRCVLAAWLVVYMLQAGSIVQHKNFGGDSPQRPRHPRSARGGGFFLAPASATCVNGAPHIQGDVHLAYTTSMKHPSMLGHRMQPPALARVRRSASLEHALEVSSLSRGTGRWCILCRPVPE
jgi:hypothetical protein